MNRPRLNRRDALMLCAAACVEAPRLVRAAGKESPALPVPPRARRIPKRTVQLGRMRIDDYAWMRDPHYQRVLKNPSTLRKEIRAHLLAENAYCDAVLAPIKPLRARLIEEMRARIPSQEDTAAQPDGPWLYFARYAPNAERPVYMRRPRQGAGAEQALLDANSLGSGKPFFTIVKALHSPDHSLLAYALDEQGSEYYRIFTIDLATGKTLPKPLENAHGSFVFSPDSKWLLWVARDANGRPSSVYRRPVRGGRADEQRVFHEKDEGLSLTVSLSSDLELILITSQNQQTSETWYLPAADFGGAPRLVWPRRDGVLYRVDRWKGRLVALTNSDQAIDYKVVRAEGENPSKAAWSDLIAHRPGRYIADMIAFADHLVLLDRLEARDRVVILDDSGHEEVLGFEEEAFALSLDRGFEFDDTLRFVYQSPVTPRQWWDVDLRNRKRTLHRQDTVPGHDPSRYAVRRLYAAAQDGARIPITVVMKRTTPLDGSAPLHLLGYGAYGLPMEPVFSSANLCLLDRGWICATAHIRGGSENGWGWFLAGRAFTKKNTFTDYIACAEKLCDAGYGRRGRILAYGRSAGGMLMGAILNLRPDLWAGVLTGVPFVDVLNTMSDTSLPLTPPEWPEWGNPLTDPAAYDYIASYSPYDNVRQATHPAVLATCGLTDPRVTYWEPAKWVARLRASDSGRNPILLHTDMEAGHQGVSGRFDALRDAALNHAFALWALSRGDSAELKKT